MRWGGGVGPVSLRLNLLARNPHGSHGTMRCASSFKWSLWGSRLQAAPRAGRLSVYLSRVMGTAVTMFDKTYVRRLCGEGGTRDDADRQLPQRTTRTWVARPLPAR